ncbi:MAG TPA: oxidative damage protection protein [Gammaproteobacteria bacterium]|nr:oxidative damage protection protein [Gammaproteobacteria bacterium]
MTHHIFCIKLQKEAEGLDKPPFFNALGEKIYQNVSKEAWQMWLGHQTMLINEYRLSSIDPKARQFLIQEMEKFFFGEGSAKPEGYTPKK